jgi:hypothetical protein
MRGTAHCTIDRETPVTLTLPGVTLSYCSADRTAIVANDHPEALEEILYLEGASLDIVSREELDLSGFLQAHASRPGFYRCTIRFTVERTQRAA